MAGETTGKVAGKDVIKQGVSVPYLPPPPMAPPEKGSLMSIWSQGSWLLLAPLAGLRASEKKDSVAAQKKRLNALNDYCGDDDVNLLVSIFSAG